MVYGQKHIIRILANWEKSKVNLGWVTIHQDIQK
jgi:hypothetical protein